MEESKPSVEDLLALMVHQQMRNYDVLMYILRHFNKKGAEFLIEEHENMRTWGPPPFFVEDEVEE